MKGNLLIIDDEKVLASNLKELLGKYADKIFIAYNGSDGLRILRDENIHCVICDIYMPEMTGLEVIKAVRESGNRVPFIFFTAYGVDEIKIEASQYERTVFLLKPEIKAITAIIANMLKMGLDEKDVFAE